MNKTTVIHLNAKKIAANLRESYSMLIMFSAYIIGVVLGSVLVSRNLRAFKKAEALYESFISDRTEKAFVSVLASALWDWMPFMLALFVCGTCIAGMVILPFFIGYKGFCYGALAGYIYSNFALNGIVFVLIFIIPAALIGAFGLFLAGKRSFSFSLLLARGVLPYSREYNMYNMLIHYCKEFAFLTATSICAALSDAALSVAFWDKIKLT